MADSTPVDDILEFLRRNNFTNAEAALKCELGNRPDLNGVMDKLKLDCNESSVVRLGEGVNGVKSLEQDREMRDPARALNESSSSEASKELIVKEVECEVGRYESERKWKSCGAIGEQSMVNASVGTSDNSFTSSLLSCANRDRIH